MKILYIVTSLDAKAPIFVARDLAQYFVAQGNEVEVCYFDNIVKTKFPCQTKRISISKPINFDDYDIIHTHMYRPDKYVAKFYKFIHKAKTISTVHCDIEVDMKYTYGSFVSAIFSRIWINRLRRIDCTVQINDFILKKYLKRLKKSVLIYNGVQIDQSDNAEYFPVIQTIEDFHKQGLITIISYSGIIERKGLDQIIEAVKRNSKLSYVCIGEGNAKEHLMKTVDKYKLSSRVSFFDYIRRPYNLVKYADVFAIPSHSEGFSLAMLEAGMVGVSVICSDIPAFSDLFTEREVTFFKINDIDSLVNAVQEAYAFKEKRKNALLQKVSISFSLSNMLDKYEALYRDLILNH